MIGLKGIYLYASIYSLLRSMENIWQGTHQKWSSTRIYSWPVAISIGQWRRKFVHGEIFYLLVTTHRCIRSNPNELYDNVNVKVNGLYQWFCSNKLSLNSKKSKYSLLTPRHRRGDVSRYSIQIGNIELDRIGNNCNEQSTKFFDTHIDENLTRKRHIAAVKGKMCIATFYDKQVKQIA